MRGAKMKRAKKFRKKSTAMNKTAPALALKGSGMGHDFSISIGYKTKDQRLQGQVLLKRQKDSFRIFCLKRRAAMDNLVRKKPQAFQRCHVVPKNPFNTSNGGFRCRLCNSWFLLFADPAFF
jgi:hypothetical protein